MANIKKAVKRDKEILLLPCKFVFMILIVNNQYIIRIIQLYTVLTKGISYYIYKSVGKISCFHTSAIYSFVHMYMFRDS